MPDFQSLTDLYAYTKAAEEKQRRKDDKRAAKAGATENGSSAEGEGGDEQVIFDGIGSVIGHATSKAKGKGKSILDDMEVDEEAPILINHDLPNLQSVLDQADVVLQVLDARDPLAFRSSHLEELIAAKPGRQTISILNKIGPFILLYDLLYFLMLSNT